MLFFGKKTKKQKLAANLHPKIRTKTVPGPKSQKIAESLKRFECPQITFVNENYPVFLEKASGCNLTDVDGNRYLDLTSAFGVAGIGHTSPAVLKAVKQQSRLMLHGMGDVHPNEVKVLLQKSTRVRRKRGFVHGCAIADDYEQAPGFGSVEHALAGP